ncbi:MAG: restriction endonuclease S subunit, partial [bacterium]
MSFPINWQKLPLETVLATLIDYRGKTPIKQSFGIPLITAKIVKNGRIEDPNEFISEEDYKSWMTRGYPKVGDVVITTEAPTGEVAQLISDRIALAQRIVLLRGKSEQLDNTYLKYCLMTEYVQSQIHARGSGTTVVGIKQSELRKIQVIVPTFPEQQNIAKVLGNLDSKIELNRKMNATLEQMAQAFFKSWFV